MLTTVIILAMLTVLGATEPASGENPPTYAPT